MHLIKETAMKAHKVLVEAGKYNNYSNVVFMMGSDDSRLKDQNYKILDAKPIYDHKTKTLVSNGKKYRIYSDWSAKAI
jgi:hypothetical protein